MNAIAAAPAWPPLRQSNGLTAPWQRHLLRWAVVTSILIHAALLLNLPGLRRHDHSTAPLQVSLRAAQPAPSSTAHALAASQSTEARRLPPQHVKAVAPATLRAKEGAAGPAMPANNALSQTTPSGLGPSASISTAAPPPATAHEAKLGSPGNDSAALERYGRNLAELLARQQQYPRLAALRGWEGEVRLQVRVARKGNIVDIQLAHSSGFAVLDQQALQLIAGTALPPLPDSVQETEIQLIVPIHFKLNKAT